jgi:hypothetical protein
VPYRIEDKWGIADFFEKMVIEPKYEEVRLFSDQITPTKTDKSLARVKLNGLYGYVDESGNEVIEPMYDKASDFNNGYALVIKGRKSFVIDVSNNIVNDSLYKAIELLPNYTVSAPLELLPPLEKSNWDKEYNDLACEKVLPIKGNDMGFLVKKNGKWGVVQYGELWVPIEYDSIHPYAGRSYVLFQNDKQGLCVRFEGGTPQTITDTKYDEIKIIKRNGYSGQLYWYRTNDYWGFISSRKKFVEPKYKTLDISKERDFLYEVTTKNGDFGYYLIGLNKEYFKEKIPPTLDELKIKFIEAETYANNYIEQLLTGIDPDKLIKDMEDCLQAAMNKQFDDKNAFYNGSLTPGAVNIDKLDTNLLSSIADIFYTNGIVDKEAINVSPKLIEACQHLNTKFSDLIEKYPNYPFSQIVKTLKIDIINETNPHLVSTAMAQVYGDCDFNTEFYQKVILLYNFYGLVYYHLVEEGKIKKPFEK